MAGLMYFVEGHQATLTQDQIDQYGLRHAFDRGRIPYHAEIAGETPSGRPGSLITNERKLAPYVPAYAPAEQRWKQMSERAWVGLWKAAVPGPEDLARAELLPGYPMVFEDGKAWRVPVVFVPDSSGVPESILPRYLDVDAQGNPTRGETLDKYAWMVETARPFFDAWLASWTPAVDGAFERKRAGDEDALNDISYMVRLDSMAIDAAKILGANYRVSLPEVALLRLWRDDRSMADVLRAACDIDECEAILFAQKKSQLCEPSNAAAG